MTTGNKPASRFERSSVLQVFAVICLSGLLAACAGGPNGAVSGSPSSRYGASGRPPAPGEEPPVGGPPPSVTELAAEPLRFKGMAGREVVTVLGEPNFRRREAPAEIWQYYGQGCVLDLFLYADKGNQRVSHVELRSRSPGQGAEAGCLSPLFAGRRGQPAS